MRLTAPNASVSLSDVNDDAVGRFVVRRPGPPVPTIGTWMVASSGSSVLITSVLDAGPATVGVNITFTSSIPPGAIGANDPNPMRTSNGPVKNPFTLPWSTPRPVL